MAQKGLIKSYEKSGAIQIHNILLVKGLDTPIRTK